MRPMFRPDATAPVQAMKTYEIHAPLETHFREVSCAEYGCDAYRSGWRTVVDILTDLGRRQADYIRGASGRRFREQRTGETLITFTFAPGQRCFARDPHRVRLDRPEIYVVRGGDWRAHLGVLAQHTRAADWVDDFASHQDKIKTLAERG